MDLALTAGEGAFRILSTLFTDAGPIPIELEILPKSLQPVDGDIVRDGDCVGVTERLLVYAFLFASKTDVDKDGTSKVGGDPVFVRSAVKLLYDPEHLTAANALKRHVKCATAGRTVFEAVQYQLWLLDSFHTSPLNKHTKSPTLWHHRLWLLSNYWDQYTSIRARTRPGISIFDAEASIIFRAGTIHPKNYYAWDYARKLMRLISDRCTPRETSEMLDMAISSVHNWCLSHPGDVSGWSFLLFLLRQASDRERSLIVVASSAETAVSFRWGGDVIWGFVGQVLACRRYLEAVQRDTLLARLRVHLGRFYEGESGQVKAGYETLVTSITKILDQAEHAERVEA